MDSIRPKIFMEGQADRLNRFVPPLKFAAALFFLNALLGLGTPSVRTDWVSLIRVSPDFLLLLLGICLLVRNGMRFRPTIYAALTATVMFLKSFESADRLVPMIFNRAFNLLLDARRLPDFVFLFWQTRPTGQFLVSLTAGLAAAAGLAGCVWCALRTLHHGLAQRSASRLSIRLPAAALAAGLLAAPVAGALPDLFVPSVIPRVVEEIRFILDFKGICDRHRAILDNARKRAFHISSGLEKLEGASVVLIVVESYGMSAFSDLRHAHTVLPAARTAEAELRSSGFHMVSGYLTSPTFGGGSWLSHATLASGVRIASEIEHDLLLASNLVPLAEYFNRAGYRTARAMPGTLWPWPQGAFYRYRQSVYAPDFGYRGPSFGFSPIPDQFVLDWVGRRVIRGSGPEPLFVEVVLTGSHAAFDIQAPYLDDWDRIGDGSVFRKLPPVLFPVNWTDLSQASEAYSAAIVHEIMIVKEFIRRFLDGSQLVIIVGDHQPAVELVGEDQPWSVPVHVVSRNAAFIREFTRRGYTAGMVPDQPLPHAGMETLFWDVLDGFGAPG
ncbi:MAG: hypothetical protein ACM3KE_04610 [Hyphomicrobiales bacterium]